MSQTELNRLHILEQVLGGMITNLSGLFWLAEDFEGYRRLIFDLVTHYGIPVAVYTDRHTLFFSPKFAKNGLSLEEQLLGQKRPLTQIGRILNELGIR
ncbi:MAG: hypothetical protein ACPLRZ_05100, partial [Thermovenabulum sp.]